MGLWTLTGYIFGVQTHGFYLHSADSCDALNWWPGAKRVSRHMPRVIAIAGGFHDHEKSWLLILVMESTPSKYDLDLKNIHCISITDT